MRLAGRIQMNHTWNLHRTLKCFAEWICRFSVSSTFENLENIREIVNCDPLSSVVNIT